MFSRITVMRMARGLSRKVCVNFLGGSLLLLPSGCFPNAREGPKAEKAIQSQSQSESKSRGCSAYPSAGAPLSDLYGNKHYEKLSP